MNRRAVLAGLAVGPLGALAGCMAGGCTASTSVSFEPVDAEAIAADGADDVDDAPAMMARLADRVLAGEEPTVETLYRDPLGWLTYVEHDGSFFEIAAETIAEGRVSGPEYELSRDREMDADALADDAIAFTDLPRHDRWRVSETVDYAISPENIRGRYSVSSVAGYLDESDQADSVLASGIEASAIEAGGHVARIERLGEGSIDARRYRYAANPVTDDVEAFADHVLERRGSTAFDPSDEVRQLLSETQDAGGSMTICDHELDDVDEETAERRRAAADELEREVQSLAPPVVPDDEEHPQVRYVRYEGDWYRIDISHGVV
ncbi:hypothetical protein [Halovivax cerinus]|uniref:Uncharacterized protein n=1 Tax=Halovivax cerinus TaxID=1487865 RepID=A0ABD5NPA2_9EURY|nr:hypothetical protein [Halovivax cerinus]